MSTASVLRTVVPFLLGVAGCAEAPPELPPFAVDVSPVDCGYKWFQTGHSPRVRVESCEADRTSLRDGLMTEAVEHAWDTARLRCPAVCPPIELPDTVEWDNPLPDGSCRENRLHYISRVFFECGGTKEPQPRSTPS